MDIARIQKLARKVWNRSLFKPQIQIQFSYCIQNVRKTKPWLPPQIFNYIMAIHPPFYPNHQSPKVKAGQSRPYMLIEIQGIRYLNVSGLRACAALRVAQQMISIKSVNLSSLSYWLSLRRKHIIRSGRIPELTTAVDGHRTDNHIPCNLSHLSLHPLSECHFYFSIATVTF